MTDLQESSGVLNIHDNNIYAYSVLCQDRRIVLHTEFTEQSPAEYTDIVFSGVLVHSFRGCLENNIVFQISQIDLASLISEDRELFAQEKPFHWPPFDYSDEQGLLQELTRREMKAFVIHSSYGMGGWILAETMTHIRREARWNPEQIG